MTMKRFFKKSALLGTACLLCTTMFCFSCKGKLDSKTNVASETENTEAISLDTINVKEYSDSVYLVEYHMECFKNNTPLCNYINAQITSFITDGKANGNNVRESVQQVAKSEIEKVKENAMELDLADAVYNDPLFYIIKKGAFEKDCADSVWAYTTKVEDFMGGAHGSYQINTYNFSKTSGKLIELGQVLNLDKSDEIIELLTAQLIKDMNCTTVEQLMEETALLTLSDMYVSNDFHLGKNGITFRYGQYSIGPYSAGITEITLSYASLKNYMY